jgi:Kef-type K+ transport system membrane component KefB
MNDFALLGIAIFAGILIGRLFDRLGLPEVIGTVLVGVVMGGSILNLITTDKLAFYRPLIDLAIAFFGFFIGVELKFEKLKELEYVILSILFFEVLFTFTVVLLSLYIFTREFYLSLLLGSLAVSTAPAATADVIWEYKATGPLTFTILAIVAFDDVATVLIYSFSRTFIINSLLGSTINIFNALVFLADHIIIAVVIGLFFGGIFILLSRFFKRTREIYIIILGLIILASGIAEIFNASEILSNIILGMIFSNYYRGSEDSVDAIRDLSAPIFTLFFVLIGAKLRLDIFLIMYSAGLVYLIAALSGKTLGSTFGALISKAESVISRNIGFTLYSQAGIALGLGSEMYFELIHIEQHALATRFMNILIVAVLMLLLIGPIMVKYALGRAGEIGKRKEYVIGREY